MKFINNADLMKEDSELVDRAKMIASHRNKGSARKAGLLQYFL
jgi:hypothetical protein